MSAVAISHILVPVDFSPCSRAALDYAAELAGQTNADVEVLYVHEPTGYPGPDSLAVAPQSGRRPGWDETRGDVVKELEAFLGEARPRVRSVRVEAGIPEDVIPSLARDGAFDLIVMGTHGRSGLSRLVVGSVAESVMRRAKVPVLTLRMPRKEQRERVPL